MKNIKQQFRADITKASWAEHGTLPQGWQIILIVWMLPEGVSVLSVFSVKSWRPEWGEDFATSGKEIVWAWWIKLPFISEITAVTSSWSPKHSWSSRDDTRSKAQTPAVTKIGILNSWTIHSVQGEAESTEIKQSFGKAPIINGHDVGRCFPGCVQETLSRLGPSFG